MKRNKKHFKSHMTYIEFKGKRFQVKPAKGNAWECPCDYCDMVGECEINPSFNFFDDYYPERIIFEKL